MWLKVSLAVALIAVVFLSLALTGVLLLNNTDKHSPTIFVLPTQQPQPDVSTQDDVGNWMLRSMTLEGDIQYSENSRDKIIDACASERVITYSCTASTNGNLNYEISVEGSLEGSSEVITAAVGVNGEYAVRLSQGYTSGVSDTEIYKEGYIYTVEVKEVSAYRTGGAIAQNKMGDVLNGTFTAFLGSCDVVLSMKNKVACEVPPAPVVENAPAPEVQVPADQSQPSSSFPAATGYTLDDGDSLVTSGTLVVCTGDIKVNGVALYDGSDTTGLVTVLQAGANHTIVAPFGAFCDQMASGQSFDIDVYTSRLLWNGCEGGCSRIEIMTVKNDGSVSVNMVTN